MLEIESANPEFSYKNIEIPIINKVNCIYYLLLYIWNYLRPGKFWIKMYTGHTYLFNHPIAECLELIIFDSALSIVTVYNYLSDRANWSGCYTLGSNSMALCVVVVKGV